MISKKHSSKATKKAGSKFNVKRNYSDFWMDSRWDSRSMFGGISNTIPQTSDIVKAIKLANYRRAVTNFVKILTKQEIPVMFAGTDSYTNGKSIVLSTDIKESNFDVTVGLALHEASHIILTDFEILPALQRGDIARVEETISKRKPGQSAMSVRSTIQGLLNWVEDRRIDHFVFSTSPGYKAYYHKLYNHYFHDKSVTKALQSANFRGTKNLNIDTYMMHIINMINPAFQADALPGLKDIVEVVDLRNISRLKSTMDALHVACDIMDIILENLPEEPAQDQQGEQEGEEKPRGGAMPGNGDQKEDNKQDDQQDSQDSNDEPTEEEKTLEELTPKELYEAQKALAKQKEFLDGNVDKKQATKGLTNKLKVVAKQSIDIQTVGTTANTFDAIVADYSSPSLLGEIADIESKLFDLYETQPHSANYRQLQAEQLERQRALGYEDIMRTNMREDYKKQVLEGINLGALLGKKLQLHNEARERVDMRLRNGKIDNKRLAHAGYGIENIFKQISIDKYKNANLHISLDASGSMGGDKWAATVKLTAAIVKALTYTQGINVQVSIRGTFSGNGRSESPTIVKVYDSKTSKNNPSSFFKVLPALSTSYSTPEGLCFEAMIAKNMLVQGTSELDSYFLNISDGEPGMGVYYGTRAIEHTATQIKKMESQLNMKIISFFMAEGDLGNVTTRFNGSSSGSNFRRMYGKHATVVNPESAMDIARALNKKFMEK